jgi:hypothetical protein
VRETQTEQKTQNRSKHRMRRGRCGVLFFARLKSNKMIFCWFFAGWLAKNGWMRTKSSDKNDGGFQNILIKN